MQDVSHNRFGTALDWVDAIKKEPHFNLFHLSSLPQQNNFACLEVHTKMKISLRIDVVIVAFVTVVIVVFSSHVTSCQGKVVGVGKGHAPQQHDWVYDDSDATEENAVMIMSNEEGNQRGKVRKQRMSNSSNTVSTSVVRRLRSLPSRRRVGEDEADNVTGGYVAYYRNHGESICQEIGNASIPITLSIPPSSDVVVSRSGTIESLTSDDSPYLPTPVANAINSSSIFEDATVCYIVPVASFKAASSNAT
jgi:hypothetical protein